MTCARKNEVLVKTSPVKDLYFMFSIISCKLCDCQNRFIVSSDFAKRAYAQTTIDYKASSYIYLRSPKAKEDKNSASGSTSSSLSIIELRLFGENQVIIYAVFINNFQRLSQNSSWDERIRGRFREPLFRLRYDRSCGIPRP